MTVKFIHNTKTKKNVKANCFCTGKGINAEFFIWIRAKNLWFELDMRNAVKNEGMTSMVDEWLDVGCMNNIIFFVIFERLT